MSVLSGNRNFEGRINPDVKMNYLASPPLVVAYALAGTMDIDLSREPLGTDTDGQAGVPGRHLAVAGGGRRRSWPARWPPRCSPVTTPTCSTATTTGATWTCQPATRSQWDEASTYVRRPPYFDGMPAEPEPVTDIHGARVLAKLGDSVTTDHISPAGAIKADSSGRAVPDRARRRARGLQLLRVPAR